MTAAPRRAGLGLVVLYVAVAVATHGLGSRPVRPLFDGFAPPIPYRWVKPPPELAADNQPPQPAERTVPFNDQGSEPTNASTADAQVILTLPERALLPHPPDTAALVRLTPLDAGTLAPVPAGLRVVSNAYQLSIAYQPSQAPAGQIAATASIALTAGTRGDTLLYSPGGQAWQSVEARPFGSTDGVIGKPPGPGYYVVAASPDVTTTSTAAAADGGSGGAGVVVAGLVAIAVIVVAGLALRSGRPRKAPSRKGRSRPRGKRRGGRSAGPSKGAGAGSRSGRRRS